MQAGHQEDCLRRPDGRSPQLMMEVEDLRTNGREAVHRANWKEVSRTVEELGDAGKRQEGCQE